MTATYTDRISGVLTALAIKAPVAAATTGNITLSGEQTIDGVAVVSGNRVLVKDQTAQTENGIYVVSSGPWARANDFDGSDEIAKGTLVFDNTRSLLYRLSTADPITVDTSNITFTDTGLSAGSYQPLDSDLTAIAALTTTSFGRSVLALATAAALRGAAELATTTTDNALIKANGTSGGTQGTDIIVDDSENISGINTILIGTPATATTATGNLQISSASGGAIQLCDTDGTTNEKNWRFRLSGSTFQLTTQEDDNTSVGIPLAITRSGTTVTGVSLSSGSGTLAVTGPGSFTQSGATVLTLNRTSDDGTIVDLQQAGSSEGTISVSGTTITYGTFCGAHVSQLPDNSVREILPGTIMETVDEMCEWENGNDQLAKVVISNTPASAAVYGGFMHWMKPGDTADSGDMNIVGLGAWLVRIGKDHVVRRGDLIESAGDGTGRPQEGDLITAATVCKVTSSKIHTTYEDGSYLVPCVYYCG